MGIEYEVKFRSTAQQQASIRAAFCGKETEFQMQTTYYDTPEADLSAKHYTLRRRMENENSVCTLKAPLGELARGEWEVFCQDIEKAIPMLCEVGAPQDLPMLCRSGLVPVCGARFTRIAKTLILEQGVLELAFDTGVLTGGGKEIPLCEVEVELKSGTTDFANQFAARLAESFGLIQERKSKFRRALALSRGE